MGQSRLIQLWEQLFSIYGIHVGQMLLTRADMEDRERFLNARDTLRALLDNSIVPVINENDAVATAEIKVGDNDNLSALAAILAGADKLLLLTDQPGLFTADPRSNPQAELIKDVYGIDDALRAIAGDSVSGLGTGGMGTKLQAADVACRAGIDTIIAAGNRPDVIGHAMAGLPVGTCFHAQESPLENRKRWIFGAPPAGEITSMRARPRRSSKEAARYCQKASKSSAATSPAAKLSASAIAKDATSLTASAATTAMRCALSPASTRSKSMPFWAMNTARWPSTAMI